MLVKVLFDWVGLGWIDTSGPVCCDWAKYRAFAPETYHFVLALAAFGVIGGFLQEVPAPVLAILQRSCLVLHLLEMNPELTRLLTCRQSLSPG